MLLSAGVEPTRAAALHCERNGAPINRQSAPDRWIENGSQPTGVLLQQGPSGRKAADGLFLAVRALAGRGLACRERIDRSGAALLEVLVGLRFLLFLVAAHLSLGHDDLPGARLKRCCAAGP